MASAYESLSVSDYLSRKPEHLLLEGLRQWNGGYETGCMGCWEKASDQLTSELGFSAAAEPLFLMGRLVRQLRQSSGATPCFYPAQCRRMCRDECCLMAMMAAAQDEDRFCFDMAVSALGLEDDGASIYAIALALARSLGRSGLRLLPVPATVLAPIAGVRLAIS